MSQQEKIRIKLTKKVQAFNIKLSEFSKKNQPNRHN